MDCLLPIKTPHDSAIARGQASCDENIFGTCERQAVSPKNPAFGGEAGSRRRAAWQGRLHTVESSQSRWWFVRAAHRKKSRQDGGFEIALAARPACAPS